MTATTSTARRRRPASQPPAGAPRRRQARRCSGSRCTRSASRPRLFFVLPFVFVVPDLADERPAGADPRPVAAHLQWHNYVDVWHTPGFLTWWRNTLDVRRAPAPS